MTRKLIGTHYVATASRHQSLLAHQPLLFPVLTLKSRERHSSMDPLEGYTEKSRW
jgi:hypothetical protein